MKKESSTKFLKLCLADALLKMMETQNYDSINITAVCEQAGVGRTTYYRYFDKKSSKEDLLVFKLVHEWKAYNEKHKEEAAKDGTMEMLRFAYENRTLFRLMYKNGLVTAIMKVFDEVSDWTEEKIPLICAPSSCMAISGSFINGSNMTLTKHPNRFKNI